MSNEKIAKNLRAFVIAINAHDRENPMHSAWGIGLAFFDMERLGLDEDEEIIPGIVVKQDEGQSGNFRVLCDGDHDAPSVVAEEAEQVEDDALIKGKAVVSVYEDGRWVRIS